MNTTHHHLEELAEIRKLMEKSSKFLSLSGLSGVFAGSFAIIGSFIAWWHLGFGKIKYNEFYQVISSDSQLSVIRFLVIDAFIVLFLALTFAWYFSRRKAAKMGVSLWNSASRRLLVNPFIPLVTGGIFCIIILFKENINLIAPLTLIFYGLGLVNAGKYTNYNINYLGIIEIIAGLVATIFSDYSFIFWVLGFGVWHIVYGSFMFYRYERSIN